MSIRRKLTTSAIALGVLAGGGLAAAPAAQAGTSIGSTYNGASHIYYKFYASTNQFCAKHTGKNQTHEVAFYKNGKWKDSIFHTGRNEWTCSKLTDHGIKEGDRIKFTLQMSQTKPFKLLYKKSVGYVNV
jgi:hypothetical protein